MSKPTMSVHVRAYVDHRRHEGLSPLTLSNIRRTLDDFADSYGHRPIDRLGARAVDRWLERHTDWASSTRSVKVSIVRTFAAWCETEGRTKAWASSVPKVRRPRTMPRFVSPDQFAATLAETTSTRERAILWLLYGLGLRCVEVAQMRVEDWDRRDDTVLVRGKGGHERVVPIPAQVAAALRAYLAEFPAGAGPLVRRANCHASSALSPNTVSSLTRRMLRRAGVKGSAFDGVCAHGMRSAAATSVLESSGDIRVAQELLGHQHASTTSAYFRRAGLESVRAALARRSDMPAA